MFYNFKKNKKAFTLVELIVVIAIIAILGTAATIATTSILTNAKKKTAISNASALKTAISLTYPTGDESLINAIKNNYDGKLSDLYTADITEDLMVNAQSKDIKIYCKNDKHYCILTITKDGAINVATSTTETLPSGTKTLNNITPKS